MNRTCLRCGHINTTASGTPEEACPSCGAVYSKVEAFVAKNGMAALDSRNRSHQPQPVPPENAGVAPPAKPAIYKRPWFYIPLAFIAGPLVAGITGITSSAVALAPFWIAILFAVFTAYSKSKEQAITDAAVATSTITPNGKYVCLKCGSRFNKPKMRGSGWIEVVLYVFLAIVGGVIYSIWRRTGSNMECPQCGSRAFRLASDAPATPSADIVAAGKRVPCPECHELILDGAKKCKHCGSRLA